MRTPTFTLLAVMAIVTTAAAGSARGQSVAAGAGEQTGRPAESPVRPQRSARA